MLSTVWVTTFEPFVSSASWAAATRTVRGVFQLSAPKVMEVWTPGVAGSVSADRSSSPPLSSPRVMETPVPAAGATSSTTV